jgi:hypothetical protein
MANWFDLGVKHLLKGDLNFTTGQTDLYVMLMGSGYTFTKATQEFLSTTGVRTNEITGDGYTEDGEMITIASSQPERVQDTDWFIRVDGADVSWTTASFTAYGALLYKNTGTDSTSILIAYQDFGGAKTVTNGTFTLQWDADGILRVKCV